MLRGLFGSEGQKLVLGAKFSPLLLLLLLRFLSYFLPTSVPVSSVARGRCLACQLATWMPRSHSAGRENPHLLVPKLTSSSFKTPTLRYGRDRRRLCSWTWVKFIPKTWLVYSQKDELMYFFNWNYYYEIFASPEIISWSVSSSELLVVFGDFFTMV